MLLLPILAAELVLAATPDATGAFGPFVGPQVVVSVGESSDPDGRDAKRGRSPAKPDPFGAKLSSRGRAVPPDAVERVENGDEAFEAARSTRGSMYVCPSDMVMIGRSYCIDVYEASLLQAAADGSEKPWPFYQVLPAGVVVRAVSVPGVYPQGYVSGLQARAACERSGKRLCAPGEWKNACMGPKKTIFPYGNARQTGRCNDNGRSAMRALNPALDGKPEHRWMWGYAGNMIDPRLNQLDGTLTRTGERASCTNEYGVFDMVGNLHEWVDDPDGTFQGGYYLDTHLNGDGCYYRTTAHPMSHYDYSTGFRCCADVAAP